MSLAKAFGWLTILGLALIALAAALRTMDVAYPIPFALLCLGAAFFFIAGIAWSHTPGKAD